MYIYISRERRFVITHFCKSVANFPVSVQLFSTRLVKRRALWWNEKEKIRLEAASTELNFSDSL